MGIWFIYKNTNLQWSPWNMMTPSKGQNVDHDCSILVFFERSYVANIFL